MLLTAQTTGSNVYSAAVGRFSLAMTTVIIMKTLRAKKKKQKTLTHFYIYITAATSRLIVV